MKIEIELDHDTSNQIVLADLKSFLEDCEELDMKMDEELIKALRIVIDAYEE